MKAPPGLDGLQADVVVRKMMMMTVTWLLVLLLLCESKQDGRGQENDVLYCRHQNRTLTISGQTFLLTWEDDPSCSALNDTIIYELRVFLADEEIHHDEVAVASDQIGSTHSWNWTSHLALNHSDHSVRLTSRYVSQINLCIFPGRPDKIGVYPVDKYFEVGSNVIFCCSTPAGESFKQIHVTGYSTANMSTRIRDQTYALRVHFNRATYRYINVECETSNPFYYGTTTYIGRPPHDRDLQCETRDLESAECHWTVGSDSSKLNPTTYQLLGSTCEHGHEGRCSLAPVKAGEENYILTAQNKLGKLVLRDSGDLMKRVHMLAPDRVKASNVSARDAVLHWTIHKYRHLNVTCQIKVSDGITNTTTEHSGVGLNASVLSNLTPNWKYYSQVRCATAQHFWKWGDWSERTSFHTEGDVPDALDVWMHMKENNTVIMWKKPLANQSHGDILQYEVTWTTSSTSDQPNQVNVSHSHNNLALGLDPREEHVVIVTARNKHGNSSPSTIIVPKRRSDGTIVRTSRIIGIDGGFNLSWPSSPAASCGYIVDWCPSADLGPVEWLKLPPNQTSRWITSKNLRDGRRYSLSVYACSQGAPELLSRMEGYAREIGMKEDLFQLQYKQQDSDVEISWAPVPLRQQTAFIRGYVLYCSLNEKIVCNVSTDDPEATSLRAANLKPYSYSFTVAAMTAAGEEGHSTISGTLSPQIDKLIKSVLISLGGVFCLLSLLTIFCYRRWACIKQNIYPPIPKPLLTDKWITSPVLRGYPALLSQLSHSSKESVDVPELLYKPEEPSAQEYLSSAFLQTPVSDYSENLEKYISPPLDVPNAAIPRPSGLPSSSFSGTFPNRSYNLIIKGEEQQMSSEAGDQQGAPSLTVSSGYQVQSNIEGSLTRTEENPVHPMLCDFTYILLPQLEKP